MCDHQRLTGRNGRRHGSPTLLTTHGMGNRNSPMLFQSQYVQVPSPSALPASPRVVPCVRCTIVVDRRRHRVVVPSSHEHSTFSTHRRDLIQKFLSTLQTALCDNDRRSIEGKLWDSRKCHSYSDMAETTLLQQSLATHGPLHGELAAP